jgi:hypothetical protein
MDSLMTVSWVLDRWQVKGILMLVFAAFAIHYEISNWPQAQRQQRSLEDEFRHISPSPQSKPLLYDANHKGRTALVAQSYRTALTYPEIRAFYDRELARNGWLFLSEHRNRDWGRDFGGVTAEYCKGLFRASVQYAGAKAQYDWDYTLDLSWGLDSPTECLPHESQRDQAATKPT